MTGGKGSAAAVPSFLSTPYPFGDQLASRAKHLKTHVNGVLMKHENVCSFVYYDEVSERLVLSLE